MTGILDNNIYTPVVTPLPGSPNTPSLISVSNELQKIWIALNILMGRSGSFSINNSETINGSLTVTGSETLTGALTVGGNATITGNSTISGNTTITGNDTVGGNLIVTGTAAITGALTAASLTTTAPIYGYWQCTTTTANTGYFTWDTQTVANAAFTRTTANAYIQFNTAGYYLVFASALGLANSSNDIFVCQLFQNTSAGTLITTGVYEVGSSFYAGCTLVGLIKASVNDTTQVNLVTGSQRGISGNPSTLFILKVN